MMVICVVGAEELTGLLRPDLGVDDVVFTFGILGVGVGAGDVPESRPPRF
jgi:hypothetical protein